MKEGEAFQRGVISRLMSALNLALDQRDGGVPIEEREEMNRAVYDAVMMPNSDRTDAMLLTINRWRREAVARREWDSQTKEQVRKDGESDVGHESAS